jgi:hypothetical protein
LNSAGLVAEVEAQGVQDMQAGTTSQAAPQHQVAKGEMVWSCLSLGLLWYMQPEVVEGGIQAQAALEALEAVPSLMGFGLQ